MYIIKIGGGAEINLEAIVADLAELDQPFLVVLGANALRDRVGQQLGTPKQLLTSLRGYTSVYSDAAAIDLIMMTYAGLRNRRFVELCQQQGINAVGLTGLDGGVITGARNRGIRVRENGKNLIKRDFSGKPRRVNERFLRLLLDNGYRPVLTIPILDENGFAINSENDDIINVLQQALHADKILQLIEAPGFLNDPGDPTSVVATMSREELSEREQQVEGRMKRKLLAFRKLFEAGAATVVLADGRSQHPVRNALEGKGTIIT